MADQDYIQRPVDEAYERGIEQMGQQGPPVGVGDWLNALAHMATQAMAMRGGVTRPQFSLNSVSGQVPFNAAEGTPVILRHSTRLPDQRFNEPVANHVMELGLTHPALDFPIRVAKARLMTVPGTGQVAVEGLTRYPETRLNLPEFAQYRDIFADFLRSFGGKTLTSSPISASRGRVFGQFTPPGTVY